MAKKGHTEEQICGRCARPRAGPRWPTSAASMGSAKPPSTSGRRSTRGLALNELRELRQLREENAKLKRLVADLSLDRHILQEIVQKKL